MSNESKPRITQSSQPHENVTLPSNSDASLIERRGFVKGVGCAAIAGLAMPTLFDPRMAHGAPAAKAAESVVGELYNSLSVAQRKVICLSYDHKLRSAVGANWHVSEVLIGDDFFTNQQRTLIDQIVRSITTPAGYKRLLEQMNDDDSGIESYSVAIFGQPGSGGFQWEMTGRHLTLRADGDKADKVAFGGPIVYGHGEEAPKQNLFHYQTKQANKVFDALDAPQRALALQPKAPRAAAIEVQGHGGSFPGISVKELAPNQIKLVEDTLHSILGPYRPEDRDEAIEIVKQDGGLESLSMAFYQEGDLNNDKVWDIWRVEGPSLACHFRGAPHVHAFINVQAKMTTKA